MTTALLLTTRVAAVNKIRNIAIPTRLIWPNFLTFKEEARSSAPPITIGNFGRVSKTVNALSAVPELPLVEHVRWQEVGTGTRSRLAGGPG